MVFYAIHNLSVFCIYIIALVIYTFFRQVFDSTNFWTKKPYTNGATYIGFFVQKFLTVLPLLKTHEKPRIILGIFLLSEQRNLS
nr:MAG TPA: hypothetical protein [Caudoviricetes sp.]